MSLDTCSITTYSHNYWTICSTCVRGLWNIYGYFPNSLWLFTNWVMVIFRTMYGYFPNQLYIFSQPVMYIFPNHFFIHTAQGTTVRQNEQQMSGCENNRINKNGHMRLLHSPHKYSPHHNQRHNHCRLRYMRAGWKIIRNKQIWLSKIIHENSALVCWKKKLAICVLRRNRIINFYHSLPTFNDASIACKNICSHKNSNCAF